MSMGDDSRLGHGLLGFLGGVLDNSPMTSLFMRAGRQGLLAARGNRERDDEAGNLDLGEAFLGVGPAFGYAAESTPPSLTSAMRARARDAQMPGGAARLTPLPAPSGRPSGVLPDDALEQMLSDLYDPFGRVG